MANPPPSRNNHDKKSNMSKNMEEVHHHRNNNHQQSQYSSLDFSSESSSGMFPKIDYMDVVTDELSPDDFKAKAYKNQPYLTTDFEWKDYCPAVFSCRYVVTRLKDIIISRKPGMMFLLAKDNRFVIKAMRKSEVKVYFSVWENIVPSDILIFEHYDLKGSVKGRERSKVMVHERPVHKDMDFDFCFYVDPMTRAQLLAQIKYDCEFLEAEGIMDYSLFLSIQIESSHEVDKINSRKTENVLKERNSRAADQVLLERISRLTDKEILDGT